MNKLNAFAVSVFGLFFLPSLALAQAGVDGLMEGLTKQVMNEFGPLLLPYPEHVILSFVGTMLTITWMMFLRKPSHGHGDNHGHDDFLFRNFFGRFGGIPLCLFAFKASYRIIPWGVMYIWHNLPYGALGKFVVGVGLLFSIGAVFTFALSKIQTLGGFLWGLLKGPFSNPHPSFLHCLLGCLLISTAINSEAMNSGFFFVPSALSALAGLYTIYQMNHHGFDNLFSQVAHHETHDYWWCQALLLVLDKDGEPKTKPDGSPRTHKCGYKNIQADEQCQNPDCLTVRESSNWDCACGKKGISGDKAACPTCREERPALVQPASAKSLRPGAPGQEEEEACPTCGEMNYAGFLRCWNYRQHPALPLVAPVLATATPASASPSPKKKRKLPPPKSDRYL